jgi:hypothetical protein
MSARARSGCAPKLRAGYARGVALTQATRLEHDYLRSTVLQTDVSDKESGRFLKKAAQKPLLARARGVETSTAQTNKVFLLLFVHKRSLPLGLPDLI